MGLIPEILLLSNDDAEKRNLAQTLENFGILVVVRNLSEMESQLQERAFNALFCAWTFYSESWQIVWNAVQQYQPDLPVIILSRAEAEREWGEVLESGAFDFLAWPSQQGTALAVVEQAVVLLEARKAQKYTNGNSATRRGNLTLAV